MKAIRTYRSLILFIVLLIFSCKKVSTKIDDPLKKPLPSHDFTYYFRDSSDLTFISNAKVKVLFYSDNAPYYMDAVTDNSGKASFSVQGNNVFLFQTGFMFEEGYYPEWYYKNSSNILVPRSATIQLQANKTWPLDSNIYFGVYAFTSYTNQYRTSMGTNGAHASQTFTFIEKAGSHKFYYSYGDIYSYDQYSITINPIAGQVNYLTLTY